MELELKHTDLKPKMMKFTDDPCFGLLHEQIEQCGACWVKKSCATCFRNSAAQKAKRLKK